MARLPNPSVTATSTAGVLARFEPPKIFFITNKQSEPLGRTQKESERARGVCGMSSEGGPRTEAPCTSLLTAPWSSGSGYIDVESPMELRRHTCYASRAKKAEVSMLTEILRRSAGGLRKQCRTLLLDHSLPVASFRGRKVSKSWGRLRDVEG